jgi:hypothetical protein
MNNAINQITAGAIPGTYIINGELVDLGDWTETPIYDSEVIPIATNIGAQQTIRFFSNLNFQLTNARKVKVQTSMTEPSRLPQHWRAIITNIHFGFQPGTVNRVDVENIMASTYLRFVTGDQRIERDGPMWTFPFKWGIAGPLAIVAGVATEVSEFQNGVVADNAVGKKLPIYLPGNYPFYLEATFDLPFTTVGAVNLYAVLSAYLYKLGG